MAMLKSQQRSYVPYIVIGFIISIIGGACATTEKVDKSTQKAQLAQKSDLPTEEDPKDPESGQISMTPEAEKAEAATAEEVTAEAATADTVTAVAESPEPKQVASAPEVTGFLEGDKPGYFVLERGELTENRHPLPNYVPMYLKKITENKEVSRRLAYRAWDFNRDGLMDMVETINEDGAVISRSFDFDFDGSIDSVEN